MARLNKSAILEGIRGKLNSMSFEHTGDRAMDIVMAGNQVLRENKAEYQPGMFTPVIETLTAPRAEVVSGNRLRRVVEVETSVHQENGEILVTVGRQTYTATTHRTKTERAYRMPHWAGSDADLKLFCQNIEWHRAFNPPIVAVTTNTYRYHVNGGFDYSESRSLAVLAKSAACRLTNEATAREQAIALKAQRDEMRRENPPTRSQPVPAIPSPVFGATFSRIRPARAKWFQVVPPVMALSVSR